MRRFAFSLVLTLCFSSGCTSAEACEDVADDTAAALVDWVKAGYGRDVDLLDFREMPPPTAKYKRAILVLMGVPDRFDAAGCSDREVTELLRGHYNEVGEKVRWPGGHNADYAIQILADGAEGVRDLERDFRAAAPTETAD